MRLRDKDLSIFFIVLIIFGGCVPRGSMPGLTGEEGAHVRDRDEFIELNDGTIIEGDITKNGLGQILTIKRGSITLNGKKYGYKDIVAFQEEKKYYRKDAYNNFDKRIVRGRINGYQSFRTAQGTTSSYTYYAYFIQKGDNGPIVAYELKVFKKMIEDYQPAVEEFNNYTELSKKGKRIRGDSYLTNVMYVYNHRK